ncbi:SRPBCC family protein [Jatrophihabitans sp. YIM 134969]
MTTTETTSVRREVTVATTPAEAFQLFTARFDEVKPPDHTLLDAPLASTTLEPHVGGWIVDRGTDGSECRWARILAFDPPHRLVFSWRIGPDWRLVVDDANASEVEVTFTDVGGGRTQVVLEQRHLERHGPGWDSLPGALGSENGWPLYLQRLEALTAAV